MSLWDNDMKRQLVLGFATGTFSMVLMAVIVVIFLVMRQRAREKNRPRYVGRPIPTLRDETPTALVLPRPRTYTAQVSRTSVQTNLSRREVAANRLPDQDGMYFQGMAYNERSFRSRSASVGSYSGLSLDNSYAPIIKPLHEYNDPFYDRSGAPSVVNSSLSSHRHNRAGAPAVVPFRESRLPAAQVAFTGQGRIDTPDGTPEMRRETYTWTENTSDGGSRGRGRHPEPRNAGGAHRLANNRAYIRRGEYTDSMYQRQIAARSERTDGVYQRQNSAASVHRKNQENSGPSVYSASNGLIPRPQLRNPRIEEYELSRRRGSERSVDEERRSADSQDERYKTQTSEYYSDEGDRNRSSEDILETFTTSIERSRMKTPIYKDEIRSRAGDSWGRASVDQQSVSGILGRLEFEEFNYDTTSMDEVFY